MFAPLTDLVLESFCTKGTKKRGTKKNKLHWELVHYEAIEKTKKLIACNIDGLS